MSKQAKKVNYIIEPKTLVCFDPGSYNFAYSVVTLGMTETEIAFSLQESSYLNKTIVNLTHNDNVKPSKAHPTLRKPVHVEIPDFGSEIERLFRRVKPEVVGLERFTPRGMGVSLNESISIMNGIILLKCSTKKIPYNFYQASSWKRWINGTANEDGKLLDKLYKIGELRGLEHHTIDTICMSFYTFCGLNPEARSFITAEQLAKIIRNVILS